MGLIEVEDFGVANDVKVPKYTIKSPSHNLRMVLSGYGAALVSLKMKDPDSETWTELQLGMDSVAEYVADKGRYLGSTVGRFANRIGHGTFTLEGVEYKLPANNNGHTLHGGPNGFSTKVWESQVIDDPNAPGVRFKYVSADGEEGFPGELTVIATYQFTTHDELVLGFEATTSKTTVCNITNHTYWNLCGWQAGQDALGTVVQLDADKYVEVDKDLIPTGKLPSVEGTPFDFREPWAVRARNSAVGERGYDNCLILREGRNPVNPHETPEDKRHRESKGTKAAHEGIPYAGTARDTASGRGMHMYTTYPAVQIYAGGFLEKDTLSGGAPIDKGFGLCFEFQGLPDAPNHENFPSTVLRAGEKYQHTTVHQFFRDAPHGMT